MSNVVPKGRRAHPIVGVVVGFVLFFVSELVAAGISSMFYSALGVAWYYQIVLIVGFVFYLIATLALGLRSLGYLILGFVLGLVAAFLLAVWLASQLIPPHP